MPKKKGPVGPAIFKINLRRWHVGEHNVPPLLTFELHGNWSYSKARAFVDAKVAESALEIPASSLLFGDWEVKQTYPSFKAKEREIRDMPKNLLYDFNWIANLAVAEESCILVHPPADPTVWGSKYRVAWYTDIPDIPPFRKPPTPEELAALAAAAKKKGKKKK